LYTLIAIAVVAAGLITISFTGIGNDVLSVRNIKQGLDLAGGVSIVYQADKANPSTEEMSSVMTMIRERLDRRGYTEAPVATVGSNRFQVDIPGVDDAERAIEDIGRTALVTFAAPGPDGPGEVIFDGSHIRSAKRETYQDPQKGVINLVALEFDDYAAALFAEATRNYMGNVIYILMDDEILSSPVVGTVITDGSCVIEGNFTPQSAEELAALIRAGSLPFSLEVMTWYSVGATLGETALNASIISGLIGMALILIFMAAVYKAAGLAADLALIIYVGLMLVILSAFNVTLTLPGIAGIILSVGMAIDANIVIFERLKEELGDTNRSFRSAMDTAFKRAFAAIIDSNITSFIAGVILYALGTGPVKGFAVTFCIGIAVSMFTAIIITRTILKSFYAIGINKPSQYAVGSNIFKLDSLRQKPLRIVENKKIHFIVPAVLLALSLVFIAVNGPMGNGMFSYGVEFAGGTSMTVDFGREVNRNDVARIVNEVTGQQPRVQSVNRASELQITMRSSGTETLGELKDALKNAYPQLHNDDITTQDVSATVSGEMQRTAITAVFAALGAMFCYIAFRFRDVKIGASTIIKLLVNTLVLIGFYAIFRITLNNSFIIAILTVLGYSSNDTIVLFDRLRENRKLLPREDSGVLINKSVSQTLTRSLYTTVSTLFPVLCLIIFGVQSIREFALPIMLGIIFGVYTSVCLAGSILHVFESRKKPDTAA